MKKQYIGAHVSDELKEKIEKETKKSKRSLSAEIFLLLEEAIKMREQA